MGVCPNHGLFLGSQVIGLRQGNLYMILNGNPSTKGCLKLKDCPSLFRAPGT